MNESSGSAPDDRREWIEPEIVELDIRRPGDAAARSADEMLKEAMTVVGEQQRKRRDADARESSRCR